MKIELSKIQLGIVETIIEWAKLAKFSKRTVYPDNGTTFTIPLKAFDVTPNIGMNIFMKDLFDLLKQRGCFNSWSQNPYVSNENAQFVFNKVDIKKLKDFVSSNFSNKKIVFSHKLYNKSVSELNVFGSKIQLPKDRNEDNLCKIIFRSKKDLEREWSWDEFVEESKDMIVTRSKVPEKEPWRPVYNTARSLNRRIREMTGKKDFFIVKPITTLKINSEYLP